MKLGALRRGNRGFLICLCVFLIDVLCPVSIASDSMWMFPVAESIVQHGDTNLDEYLNRVVINGWYGVECIDKTGYVRVGQAIGTCANAHIYNSYPVGVSVLTVPVVIALHGVVWVGQPFFRALDHHPSEQSSAFWAGDFVAADSAAERVAASLFVALTAVLLFAIASRSLSENAATALAFLFAFTTPAWSTASRVLWQHGPSMLAISATIFLLIRGEQRPKLVCFAGFAVACAYTSRPGNSLWVLLISGYVLWRFPRQLGGYVLCALPVALAFCWRNYSIYHKLFSPYFLLSASSAHDWHALKLFSGNLAGLLFSPSRGLFIFSPVFLFSIPGMYLALRKRWRTQLAVTLICFCVITLFLIALPATWIWWGGWCYGPRMLSDLSPILALFWIPVFDQWRSAPGRQFRSMAPMALFAALALVSLFMHAQGAVNFQTHRWNYEPANPPQERRLWDWKDPQFLRGLHKGRQ